MFGDSYLGFTSLAAAVSGHPSLKAIVPRMIGTDRAVNHGGVYSMELVEWAANFLMGDRNYARRVNWSVTALSDVIEQSTGQPCPPYERLRALTVVGPQEANKAFFGTADPQGAISLPTVHWTGYWDRRCESCIADYTDMRRRPDLGDMQHLILDAIDHEFYPLGYERRRVRATAGPPGRVAAGRRSYSSASGASDLLPAVVLPSAAAMPFRKPRLAGAITGRTGQSGYAGHRAGAMGGPDHSNISAANDIPGRANSTGGCNGSLTWEVVAMSGGRKQAPRPVRGEFWDRVRSGLSPRDAGVAMGMRKGAERWFRLAGGVKGNGPGPVSGRYLSLADREEIAIGVARRR
jgi:X-Pro dipeptidyl-peptidase (S15 family)